MKKTRIIAIALVISVMLMGAGYAYWQEELTIKSTVKTGCLDLQFLPVCFLESGDYDNLTNIPDAIWDIVESPRDLNCSDYMDVTVQPTDNTNHALQCTFENIYPGAGGFISFKIMNTGTVPAMLTDIVDQNVEESIDGLRDEFDYTVHSLVLYTPKKIDFGFGSIEWTGVNVIDAPITDIDTFSEFVTTLESKMKNQRLEPFAYWEVNGERSGYNIEMPLGDEVNNETEKQTFSFDLALNFQQVE